MTTRTVPLPQNANLAFLRRLAEQATATECDASAKWSANTQLLAWFRSDPVAVIHALEMAAAHVQRPGPLCHLHAAVQALPRVDS